MAIESPLVDSVDNRESATEPCDHCGLPSPRRHGSDHTFCCNGCRGAYQLIHCWGLEDYYALRDSLNGGESMGPVDGKKAKGIDWSELADTGLLGKSTPKDIGSGLVCSRLAIEGIHCGACVWLIESIARVSPGWQNARVGMHDHSIEITFDPQVLRLDDVADQLGKIGYRVFPWVDGNSEQRFRDENRQRLVQVAIAGFCSMNAMWIAVAIYAGEYSGIAASQLLLLRVVGVFLGLVAAFGPGRVFFRGAIASIKTRTPHMDLPIALGIGVGAVAGLVSVLINHRDVYFDSVAVLVFLLLVGRWIQFRQQHRAADAVSLLMRMTPTVATLINQDGSRSRVSADSIVAGDRCLVIAGEIVPVDGHIADGSSKIDRSLMTGESQPVRVGQGDAIEAGTLNLESPISVTAGASREQSRITNLLRLVEDASSRRTPIVQLADSIASRFVLLILTLAFLTVVIWWHIDPMRAAGNAVALLIVACPCALALATPLAISVTLGRAAKRKLLIRSGEALERLSSQGTIWFDKTGTLTRGHPQLVAGSLDNQTLRLCASLESNSNHPLAMAIVDAARQRNIDLCSLSQITDVAQTTGQGIRGVVDGRHVAIGSIGFVRRSALNIDDAVEANVASIADRGLTPVAIAIDGDVTAVIGIGDDLRHEAIGVVKDLQRRGWSVGILSGDHPSVVEAVGDRLGLPPHHCLGGQTPEQKLAKIEFDVIESKQTAGQGRAARYRRTVVMVGDGVNDAAALAAADVGIAIRGGAEASLQAAPVYLATDSLVGIVQLIDASKKTVGVIRRNFRVSLGYNLLAVTLAMAGLIHPLLAAILMPISSLTILSLTLGTKTFADGQPTPEIQS